MAPRSGDRGGRRKPDKHNVTIKLHQLSDYFEGVIRAAISAEGIGPAVASEAS